MDRLSLAVAALGAVFLTSARSAPLVEADEVQLKAAGGDKAVVLLDIYWARAWRCGRFENAQLRTLSFERAPLRGRDEEPGATLQFDNPSLLSPPKHFTSYAVIVDPGEYHLAEFEVGFAQSRTQVGVNAMRRRDTLAEGRSKLGSFTAAPGEYVYIGNFAVDCYKTPIPWRFYTQGKADFADHLTQFKAKYPGLPIDKVTYRLFSTTELGEPYELK